MRVLHDFEAARGLLEEARAQEGLDVALQIEIERNLAVSAWATLAGVARASKHAREALRLARRTDDDAAVAHALAWAVRIDSLSKRPRRNEIQELAQAPVQALDEPLRVVQGARVSWAEALERTYDELLRSRDVYEELVRDAEAVGHANALAPFLQGLALVLWRLGEWESARARALEAVDVARTSASKSALVPALSTLVVVDAHLGLEESARAAAAEATVLIDETHCWHFALRVRHAVAALELSRGAPAAAYEQLQGLAASRWAAGFRAPNAVRCIPDEVSALVALGQHDRAFEALFRMRLV